MVLEVCIGSSCHIKGAYEVVEKLKLLVEVYKMQSRVTLKASFCMGHCGNGVSIRINKNEITWIKPEACEAFFENIIKNLPDQATSDNYGTNR